MLCLPNILTFIDGVENVSSFFLNARADNRKRDHF
jgi:hypothetical protein